MKRRFLVLTFLLAVCVGCAPKAQENFPVTWRQDEDEIVLYVYLSREASLELISVLGETVSFEEASEFFVRSSGGKIPLMEGALTSAAVVARHDEIRNEMEYRLSAEGTVIEIIGFKENPAKIMKGAMDFPDAPKYLADFESEKHREIVNSMIDMMSDHSFTVMIDGG